LRTEALLLLLAERGGLSLAHRGHRDGPLLVRIRVAIDVKSLEHDLLSGELSVGPPGTLALRRAHDERPRGDVDHSDARLRGPGGRTERQDGTILSWSDKRVQDRRRVRGVRALDRLPLTAEDTPSEEQHPSRTRDSDS